MADELIDWFQNNCLARRIPGHYAISSHTSRDWLDGECQERKRTIENCYKQLDVIRGLPPNAKTLASELDASLKIVLNLQDLYSADQDTTFRQIKDVVKHTLARVCKFLFGEDVMHCAINILVHKITEKAPGLSQLCPQVIFVVCGWVACLLLQGLCKESLEFLDFSERMIQVYTKDKSGESVRGIVNYLQVCALCQASDWSLAVEIIDKNLETMPEKLQGQIQYLKAFCLYHHGDHSAAMATCQQLKDAVADDQISSAVHNLIGCCLKQLGKSQLALQEFRQSLVAGGSIIHASSLFNVSALYRDQGEYDAELEALELLVQVLDNETSQDKIDDIHLRPLPDVFLTLPSTTQEFNKKKIVQSAGYSSALYTLAKRYLALKRFENAGDRFLDLLVELEDGSHEEEQNSLLPPLDTVYLEAATSLLKDGRIEEALAVCDKLLSKSKLLKHPNEKQKFRGIPAISDSDDDDDGDDITGSGAGDHGNGEFPFLERKTKNRQEKPSTSNVKSFFGPSTSKSQSTTKSDGLGWIFTQQNVSSHTPGQCGSQSRKRQRELSGGGDSTDQNQATSSKVGLKSGNYSGGGRNLDYTSGLKCGSSSGTGRSLNLKEHGLHSTVGARKSGINDNLRKMENEDNFRNGRNEDNFRNGRNEDNFRNGRNDKDGEKLFGKEDEKENEVIYTAHALLIQAKCLHKSKDSEALELCSQSLEVLKMAAGSVENETEMDEVVDTEERRAKRRKIETVDAEDGPLTKDVPFHIQENDVRFLKSDAYHLRADILTGQNKLQEAMGDILLSLQCNSGNLDALKAHALLLEKMGRKGEAVKAWAKLKDAKTKMSPSC